MLEEIVYDRQAVFNYAKEWAYKRNPLYLNFENLGGDCTNFASQCLLAGCREMNYKPVLGWYYIDGFRRTASWTGVPYLYNFLTANNGEGPFAAVIPWQDADVGDIVQLGDASGLYYHSPVVVGKRNGELFVAAHTYDAFYYPLSAYQFAHIRALHIRARKYAV